MGGVGQRLLPEDIISHSNQIFAYVEFDGISDELCFTVSIIGNISLGSDTTVYACDQYIAHGLISSKYSRGLI